MNKAFCDVCDTLITAGSMAGGFDKIEPTFKKESPFTMKHWDLCSDCASAVKQKVVELEQDAKKV